MGKNKFKQPKSYTVVVIIILAIISLIKILGFCINDLKFILNEDIYVIEKLLTEIYDVVSVWFVGSIFIILGLIVDFSKYQIRRFSLSKVDFINTKEIYREILKKYSVLSLAYIDDFKENIYKYAVIVLLNLELKNKIAIKDNGIEVIDNTNLRESESYVIARIANGILEIDNPEEFVLFAKKDGIEDGLVERNPENRRKLKNKTTKELVKKGIKNAVMAIIFAIILILIFMFLDLFEDGPFRIYI